ncbi:hypothetical protein GOODEAATRI_034587, partial [Goodea atripinnis]
MPAPFLPCSGEPTVPFSTWGKMFENSLTAIHATGNSWSDARRRALLIHALGFEGQRLFYTLPNVGTLYNEAMTALELQFAPKVNVLVARHQFRQRLCLNTWLLYVSWLSHVLMEQWKMRCYRISLLRRLMHW